MHTYCDILESRLSDWVIERARCEPEYWRVLDTLAYVKPLHPGKRKNGDPEIIHQLGICDTLIELIERCEASGDSILPTTVKVDLLRLALLHDVLEDTAKDVKLTETGLARDVGADLAHCVFLMSRKHYNEAGEYVHKTPEQNLADLTSDWRTILMKCLDRSDNFKTIVKIGDDASLEDVVYPPQKQFQKIQEAVEGFLPVLEPNTLNKNYTSNVHPYLLGARNVLVDASADFVGTVMKLDFKHVFRGWTNDRQLENILGFLRNGVRFPTSDMYPDSPIPPKPEPSKVASLFDRMARRVSVFLPFRIEPNPMFILAPFPHEPKHHESASKKTKKHPTSQCKAG